MSDDEESFIILGSTPTASMDFGESLSNHHNQQQPRSMTLSPSATMKPSMQVSTNTAANFSLLNGLNANASQQNGLSNVAAESLNGGVSMSNSIASRFLCGEVSRDEVMQVCEPSTCHNVIVNVKYDLSTCRQVCCHSFQAATFQI
jgi:hypothetical protein